MGIIALSSSNRLLHLKVSRPSVTLSLTGVELDCTALAKKFAALSRQEDWVKKKREGTDDEEEEEGGGGGGYFGQNSPFQRPKPRLNEFP